MMGKFCNKCNIEQEIINENFRIKKYPNGKEFFSGICRNCERKDAKKYALEHKKERKEYLKQYIKNNPEYRKNWYRDSKKNISIQEKLRRNISKSIRKAFKNMGLSKNGSISEYIPFTIQQLKVHIENLFEPWMNWNNYGIYDVNSWNDNNSLTWTWQLDHIIPHSEFKYNSMNDDEFKKCWNLSNLRPYSSKQNSIDGANRTRHKKI